MKPFFWRNSTVTVLNFADAQGDDKIDKSGESLSSPSSAYLKLKKRSSSFCRRLLSIRCFFSSFVVLLILISTFCVFSIMLLGQATIVIEITTLLQKDIGLAINDRALSILAWPEDSVTVALSYLGEQNLTNHESLNATIKDKYYNEAVYFKRIGLSRLGEMRTGFTFANGKSFGFSSFGKNSMYFESFFNGSSFEGRGWKFSLTSNLNSLNISGSPDQVTQLGDYSSIEEGAMTVCGARMWKPIEWLTQYNPAIPMMCRIGNVCNGKAFVGAFEACISMEDLNRFLNDYTRRIQGVFFIMDKDYNLIYSTDGLLAQSVVDAGTIGYLAPLIKSNDLPLKRQVCSCLGQVAKHSVELAELVVEADIFPAVLDRLKDPDSAVRKNAATLIREITKHTPELASLIVNSGGVAAVVDFVNDNPGTTALPGIMTLGYISTFSETMAKVVIDAKGVSPLLNSLKQPNEDHVRSAAAWALGQVGRHTSEHAEAVASENALVKLMEGFSNPEGSEDLKTKSKRALKSIIERCNNIAALEPLIEVPGVQEYVVYQFAKILPSDVKARRDFVTNGSLQKLQLIQCDTGSKLKDYILTINNVYPEEIVQYYTPGYSKSLLAKIEDYTNSSS